MIGNKIIMFHVVYKLVMKQFSLSLLLLLCVYFKFFPSYDNVFYYFLCPGKVHGSLARAGKVRGQTPKVNYQ